MSKTKNTNIPTLTLDEVDGEAEEKTKKERIAFIMDRDIRYAYLHIAALNKYNKCKAAFLLHPNLKTFRKYKEAERSANIFGSLSSLRYLRIKK